MTTLEKIQVLVKFDNSYPYMDIWAITNNTNRQEYYEKFIEEVYEKYLKRIKEIQLQ
jgi:hypothetical protein